MTTFSECAGCPVLGMCDAHITGGSWHHAKGVSPCRFGTEEKKISPVVIAS